ncbi:transcription initiation factor TFIID subunit 4-like [Gadus chalcogrammus]|uniref:transcription initiation factor TFIID subunit 4-like n=1 Tax=Gadus chalcogrammus TaxID=1042646 RepID=UPI0024C4A4FE|nr:transcription initiation factor TFIID subunit 4-like [Gadus chalcogrammus]
MAGASDPLEDMLFSEVDEKAVSDLVGSLESQLADSKADTEGHTLLENRGNGSAGNTNHHLGKTLPARVGTTTLEQQQQQQGGRHKAGVHPGTHCKGISSEKPVRASPPSSPPPLDEASVTVVADQKANASSGSPPRDTSITTSNASALSTLAPSRISISTAAPGPMVTALSPSGGTRPTNPPRKRATVASKRSASARIKSLTGGAVSTRRTSAGASASELASPAAGCTSAANPILRAGTASCSRTPATVTLSNASSVPAAGQSCGALDRGTPTIALHRLPNHIVASIAQNGNGTTVSALVQQGARLGPITSPGAQLNHNAALTLNTSVSKTDESHHKTAMASQSCNTSSVISTCSSSVVLTTAATLSSPTTAAGCAAGVATTLSGSGQTTAPNMHTNTVRLAAPSAAPVGATPAAQCQPRPGLTAPPQRIVAPQQLIVRAPQPQTTIQLPSGFTIPQGMVLVRTELGQLVMVPQQALAQAQAQNNLSPRPSTPTTGPSFRAPGPQGPVAPAVAVTAPQQAPASGAPQARAAALAAAASRPAQPPQTAVAVAPGGPAVAQEMQDNVKKCKNFLATLIKLASHNSPSPETSKNVKSLVQDLLDAKIEPEEFTSRLQAELKSSPQPYLVPFLKKSLPALRLSLLSSQHSVPTPQQGVKPGVYPGPPVAGGAAVRVHYPNSVGPATGAGGLAAAHTAGVGMKRGGVSGGQVRTPVATPCMRAQGALCKGLVGAQTGRGPAGMGPPGSGNQKNKPNDPGGGSFRDDDDINDVASMAGVNLNEESARILATNSELVGTHIRSCKDEAFLHPGLLHRRILEAAKRFGVTEVPMDSVTFISHAAQARLRTVLETVSSIAQHRLDSCKDEEWYEPSADVRSQLRFFEQLERMEKQRKDEQEREILLKAAKSRARLEDPEQARLKQKAKEMQQHELAQTRQREANLTALAAIGPRKKRKMDSAWATASGSEVRGPLHVRAAEELSYALTTSDQTLEGSLLFNAWLWHVY